MADARIPADLLKDGGRLCGASPRPVKVKEGGLLGFEGDFLAINGDKLRSIIQHEAAKTVNLSHEHVVDSIGLLDRSLGGLSQELSEAKFSDQRLGRRVDDITSLSAKERRRIEGAVRLLQDNHEGYRDDTVGAFKLLWECLHTLEEKIAEGIAPRAPRLGDKLRDAREGEEPEDELNQVLDGFLHIIFEECDGLKLKGGHYNLSFACEDLEERWPDDDAAEFRLDLDDIIESALRWCKTKCGWLLSSPYWVQPVADTVVIRKKSSWSSQTTYDPFGLSDKISEAKRRL